MKGDATGGTVRWDEEEGTTNEVLMLVWNLVVEKGNGYRLHNGARLVCMVCFVT